MLIVFGDSHTIALREGFEMLRAPPVYGPLRPTTQLALAAKPAVERHAIERDIRVGQIDHGYAFHQPFYKVYAGGLHFSEPRTATFFRRLVSPEKGAIVRRDPRTFVVCAGFYPSGALLAKHWQAHTCFAGADEGRHYLSRAAYHTLVRAYTAPLLRFLEATRDLEARISVVASPPLSRQALRSWRTETISDDEVDTMHTEFRAAFAAELDRRGIRYHLPPPEVFGEDGFLRPELASTRKLNDYHANADYGALMMAHLLEELA